MDSTNETSDSKLRAGIIIQLKIIYEAHPEMKVEYSHLTITELKNLYASVVSHAQGLNYESDRKHQAIMKLSFLETMIIKFGYPEMTGITKETTENKSTSIQILTLIDDLWGCYDVVEHVNTIFAKDPKFQDSIPIITDVDSIIEFMMKNELIPPEYRMVLGFMFGNEGKQQCNIV